MFILYNIRKFAEEGRIAAVGDEGTMSYQELEDRSEALAAYLLTQYPGKNPVIIWGDKEHDMLVGVMACLKSGRPYVMTPNYLPEKRVAQISGSCDPDLILLSGQVPFPSDQYPVVGPEQLAEIYEKNRGCSVSEENWVDEDDMICIFYTSGSTGNPKGVMVTRRNVEAFAEWWSSFSSFGIESPRWLNFTPYAFSSSIATIYNAIGKLGATTYAVNKKLSSDYPRLIDYIVKVDPHYLDCTPTFADICLNDSRFNETVMPGMKHFTVGGEPVSHGTARRMREAFPHAVLGNGYGATETTIGTVYCDITDEMIESSGPMPIGYTAVNSRVEICDENRNPVPEGEVGEMIIISDMITKGYYKNEELTKENYFRNDKGEWCFNTHDLVRRDEQGLIYYMGRSNNLVKVGGYRVELEEVERFLLQVPGVSACAVAPAMQGPRTKMLVAYVVMKPGFSEGLQTTISIKKELNEKLHPYMVPQKIQYLKELPKNTNGKLDRIVLKEMSRIEGED